MSNQALEVAIGLVAAFFVMSVIASAVVEGISQLLKKRSSDLAKVITSILSSPAATVAPTQIGAKGAVAPAATPAPVPTPATVDVFSTSVFRAFESAARNKRTHLKGSDRRTPSYVSARSFADAVIEALATTKSTVLEAEDTAAAFLGSLPQDSPIKTRLTALISEAQGDLQRVKAGLEAWFDDTMDRLSGAYKRWSQWVLVVVGIIAALILNVSAVRIVATLWEDGPVRSAVTDAASEFVQQHPTTEASSPGFKGIETAIGDLDVLKLPVGWGDGWGNVAGPGWTVLGTLITGLAVMLGAPFWFNVLTKLLALRKGDGVPPRAATDPTSATRAVVALGPPPSSTPPANNLRDAVNAFVDALPDRDLGA
jgi:hypothetical protein